MPDKEKTESLSPIVKKDLEGETKKMGFRSALKELVSGKKIHREEWEDKNNYGLIEGGILRLHKPDNKLYNWILSKEDLVASDWIVIK